MNIYTVSYELNHPQGYKDFFERLESHPHCRVMDSFWLIQSEAKASEISNELMRLLKPTDSVFVAMLTHEWASGGAHCDNWLNATEQGLD
ncbi:hypothetical protein [Modicisalibacter luteus]|uniref:CRISPR-associated protein Cas2 n=1 Tax=Modicisalibacter luteus TaxID=453962 RepID=A0ABV7M4R0_9GAMM|nr:hypothetical protein [Halomonas lutea]GHA85281.1 hypothetical protein GCM10007159_02960 [Halomonas lutea]